MKKGFFSELSGTGKLGSLLLIIVISLLIFAFIGSIVGYIITGIGLEDSATLDYNKPLSIVYLKITQIFQAIGLFIVPSIVALYLFRKESENYLQLKKTKLIWVLLSAIVMVLALPIINWLAILNQNMALPDFLSDTETWMHELEKSAETITTYFLKADTISVLILNIFIMALLPAIGEEMLFRGVLQKLFTQISHNKHIAIWITAFLFSAIHMQFFTFLPRFFMGALFGYLLVWSGSIWLPITAHFVNNGLAIIVNFLIQHKTINSDIEEIGNDNTSYIIASIILISGLLYYFYTNRVKRLE